MLFSKKKKELPSFKGRLDHIAFIMDGNGRWAQKRGLPRELGHEAGAKTFKRIVLHCADIGIETVTVYAFSTENWSRPKREVDSIMRLLSNYIDTAEREFSKHDARVRFIGDRAPLERELVEKIERLEAATASRSLTLNIALNYGGRAEIVQAVNSLISEGKSSVTEDDIASRLYTSASPYPDLVVRTGGELRISNFLLWQSAYTEYYFTDTLWPDLSDKEIDRAAEEFCRRHRRFGGL